MSVDRVPALIPRRAWLPIPNGGDPECAWLERAASTYRFLFGCFFFFFLFTGAFLAGFLGFGFLGGL